MQSYFLEFLFSKQIFMNSLGAVASAFKVSDELKQVKEKCQKAEWQVENGIVKQLKHLKRNISQSVKVRNLLTYAYNNV